MEQTGYLATKTQRPGVMAGVAAIHVAGLVGVALFAPTVIAIVKNKPEIPWINIAPPTPPPPVDPIDKPVVKAKNAHTTKVAPPRPTAQPAPYTAPDPGPLSGTGDGSGSGAVIDIQPIDPPRDPVITGARFSGRNAQPPYPPGLQRMEIQGAVTVRVLVGTDGRPVRIEMVQADNPGFFTATRDWGMRNWRFSPATRDGVPYEAWREMTVRFTMT